MVSELTLSNACKMSHWTAGSLDRKQTISSCLNFHENRMLHMEHALTSVLLRSESPQFKSLQRPIWFTLCSPTLEVSIPSTVGKITLYRWLILWLLWFARTAYKSIRENTVILCELYLSVYTQLHRNLIQWAFFENCWL